MKKTILAIILLIIFSFANTVSAVQYEMIDLGSYFDYQSGASAIATLEQKGKENKYA